MRQSDLYVSERTRKKRFRNRPEFICGWLVGIVILFLVKVSISIGVYMTVMKRTHIHTHTYYIHIQNDKVNVSFYGLDPLSDRPTNQYIHFFFFAGDSGVKSKKRSTVQ